MKFLFCGIELKGHGTIVNSTANVRTAREPKVNNRFVSDWNEVPVLRNRAERTRHNR